MQPEPGRAGTAQTAETLGRWLEALKRGDGAVVLAGLADEVEFITPHDADDAIVPYVGRKRGKAAVVEAFTLRDRLVETLALEIVDFGADGGRGWALISTRERHRQSGREFGIEAAHHFRFDPAGRITRWQSYFDPDPEVDVFRADLGPALIAAAWAGRTAEARQLLKLGADPATRDPASGLSALMIAAGTANPGLVRLLLQSGADLFVVDPAAGGSALHKACQGGSLEVVRLLVEAGAPVDWIATSTGHTPLMDAVWFKWPAIVGYLLDRGAELGEASRYGFTLAQHLAYELNVNSGERDKFVAMDAAIKARQERDWEAVQRQRLLAAVVAGDLGQVRALLADGAEVDARAPMLNSFNDAHTPLLVACRDGHVEIVAELLRAGADPNAVEPTFLAVPLHKAVYNGHADITRLLVAAPGIDLDVQGATNGYTALHDALWHGFAECAEVLVRAGARLDLRGHDGKTPLDLAIEALGPKNAVTRLIRARLTTFDQPATLAG